MCRNYLHVLCGWLIILGHGRICWILKVTFHPYFISFTKEVNLKSEPSIIIWSWHGQEASEALDDFIFFFYFRPKDIWHTHYYDFKLSQNIHFATNFKENSMASRINSGGSNDLNCIKIDPRPGEKFSFNVDIVAHLCLKALYKLIYWTYNIFENNFWIKQEQVKHLKESYCFNGNMWVSCQWLVISEWFHWVLQFPPSLITGLLWLDRDRHL